MALTLKTKKESLKEWRNYILPAYIIVSALILVYIAYSFVLNSIYLTGVNNGAEKGYQTAISQLIQQVSAKCEPVNINMGETSVEVVNMACLQQDASASPEPVSSLGTE